MKTVLALLFLLPAMVVAQDDLMFVKLQSAIGEYSQKIEHCDAIKEKNNMVSVQLNDLRNILLQHPEVLSYLSEKAFNDCLQPERAMLAETILYTLATQEKSAAYKLAESTRSIAFQPDFNAELTFKKLTLEQQNKLLSTDAFNKPFDGMVLMDRLLSE